MKDILQQLDSRRRGAHLAAGAGRFEGAARKGKLTAR